jgi:hypothetical protein
MVVEPTAGPSQSQAKSTLPKDLAIYLLARVAVVAVFTAFLAFLGVPLLVSVAVGLVFGFPLSMIFLRPLNAKVSAGLAARAQVRDTERQRLRAELRGEDETQ